MTPEQWCLANGIVPHSQYWDPCRDAYLWELVTGEKIRISGQEYVYKTETLHQWSMARDVALVTVLRDKLLAMRREHFERAYARGGYC